MQSREPRPACAGVTVVLSGTPNGNIITYSLSVGLVNCTVTADFIIPCDAKPDPITKTLEITYSSRNLSLTAPPASFQVRVPIMNLDNFIDDASNPIDGTRTYTFTQDLLVSPGRFRQFDCLVSDGMSCP